MKSGADWKTPKPDLYGIDTAKAWLATCTGESSGHHVCNAPALPEMASRGPSRLVEIGLQNSSAPRLVKTNYRDRTYRYVTLSHCWGDGTRILKTTKSNLDDHYRTILWNALPKTFQQAITITRLLGLCYIWIDSLCIVQDDQSDFEVECAQMHLVYLNCFVMIAASDARDCQYGFLDYWKKTQRDTLLFKAANPAYSPEYASHLRSRKLSVYFRLGLTIHWFEWFKAISGTLSARGWAYQERQLAPRILYYTASGVIWECRRCLGIGDAKDMEYKSEQAGVEKTFFRILDRPLVSEHFLNESTEQGFDEVMKVWLAIVEEYSQTHLTFAEDKLPALSGLAAITNALAKPPPILESMTYLAGMWLTQMHRQLLWYPSPPKNSVPADASEMAVLPSAPLLSWSWASWNGQVSFNLGRLLPTSHYDPRMLDRLWPQSDAIPLATDIRPEGKDPFGRVRGSLLELQARCKDVSPSHGRYDEDLIIYLGELQNLRITIYLDDDAFNARGMTYRLVWLMWIGTSAENAIDFLIGVVTLTVSPGIFRRVGVFIAKELPGERVEWPIEKLILI